MAISYKNLPFTVTFSLRFKNETIDKKVPVFYQSEEELFHHSETVHLAIPENVPLDLSFISEEATSKLFMDGLDLLPQGMLEEVDGGDIFLKPTVNPIVLYDLQEEYYPYIPGLYRLTVYDQDQPYFAWIRVIPKQMSEDQWEVMIEDVEKEVKGLAEERIRRNFTFSQAIQERFPADLLRQFRVLEVRFPVLMASITDLYKKMNFRIKKEYELIPKEKSRKIDEITIRHRVQHPEADDWILTPVKKLQVDLPENQMVKQIVANLVQTLSHFIQVAESFMEDEGLGRINGELAQPGPLSTYQEGIQTELREYVTKATKMRAGLNWFKSAPWFKDVSTGKRRGQLPHAMVTDVRYRSLYQVQRELSYPTAEFSIDHQYQHQWKRTDKLYEIWGFLQVVKCLQHPNLGFTPISGWIYEDRYAFDEVLIPMLPAETKIVFSRDNLRACLVYDGKIPSRSAETDIENPVYTSGTNNRPDGRLDLYEGEVYIGSLIFDLKYRPKGSIWKNDLVSTNAQSSGMKQLVSYAFNVRSSYLYGKDINERMRGNLRPVPEVWALFPQKQPIGYVEYYGDHGVKLVELSPNYPNQHLIDEMRDFLDGLVQTKRALIG